MSPVAARQPAISVPCGVTADGLPVGLQIVGPSFADHLVLRVHEHREQGRVAVTLHLLSPAQRPIQVTQDLKGFWERTYPEVRKELKGRYPRQPLARRSSIGIRRHSK